MEKKLFESGSVGRNNRAEKTEKYLFSIEDVLKATGGRLFGETSFSNDKPLISSVVIDSRRACPESLFVSLEGERVDGHDYINKALDLGSVCVLVKEKWAESHGDILARVSDSGGKVVISVPDTLEGLQNLARYHKKRFPNLTVVGVTGSNGKTTTKEILGSILSRKYSVVINEGNLNSDIGLPLSVFKISGEHEIAVLEMGMNRIGEMALLADIVHPDIGVITNIGTAHVGMLGSRQKIAEEKKSIFSRFSGSQVAVIPGSSSFREFLEDSVQGKMVLHGEGFLEGFKDFELKGLEGAVISWKGRKINFPLIGEYNVKNALAAIAVAEILGLDDDSIQKGLESVKPLFGRGEIIFGDVTVVQDCYNASPDSVFKLLEFVETLSEARSSEKSGSFGRIIGVFGAMKELGHEAESAHKEVADKVLAAPFDEVFFFGEEFGASLSFEELADNVCSVLKKGDILFLKGSRSMKLERLTGKVAEIRF